MSTTKVYPASTTTESPSPGATTPPQVFKSDHKLPYLVITEFAAKFPFTETENYPVTELVDGSLTPVVQTT